MLATSLALLLLTTTTMSLGRPEGRLVPIVVPAQPQPPPATATVRGRVVAGDTGQPVRRAEVQVHQIAESAESAPEHRATSTDADGRYELRDLPAGRYSVSVHRDPFISVASSGPTTSLKLLELRPGETNDHLDFTLLRGGVITGRVVDEFGEPIGVDVNAIRVQTVNGRREPPWAVGHASTNDIGEFRLFGLEPGQYNVQATWRRMAGDDPTSPDRTGYPPTFFPGTTIQAEAQRFTIAGQTISGLTMALAPIKTARVEGIVVDADGRPVGNILLEYLHTSASGSFMERQPVRPDGTFTFANLAPGEYVFRTLTMPARPTVAMTKLTVGSEDVKDLRLVVMPLATLSGRIVVDPSLPPPGAISLIALPENYPMPGRYRVGTVGDDLTFELSATPGRNRITPREMPPGWNLRAVRVNGVDVIDDAIDVKPGEKITGIDVELTTRVSVVAGVVRNARGEPAKNCKLAMFPTDSRKWVRGSRYFRTASADQEGRFRVQGLPAGDYYAIALESLGSDEWTSPKVLEKLRASATNVSVDEGETRSVELKLSVVP